MINLGRAVGLFNRYSPKISKGIGQVANIARNVGQVVKNGLIAKDMCKRRHHYVEPELLKILLKLA
jgi:hypothetical protein